MVDRVIFRGSAPVTELPRHDVVAVRPAGDPDMCLLVIFCLPDFVSFL